MRRSIARLVGAATVPAIVAMPVVATAGSVLPATVPPTGPSSTSAEVVTAPPPSPGSTTTAPETTGVTLPGGAVEMVPGPLSDGGAAHVVAQGIVSFGDGSFAWHAEPLNVATAPFVFSPPTGAFLVNSGESQLVASAGDETIAVLDIGEAMFVDGGGSGELSGAVPGSFSTAQDVQLVASSADFSFSPGPGRRDVNLVAALLRPGDALHVVSPFPVLVVVTRGAVLDAPEGTEVPAGTARSFNDADLSNGGQSDALVFVAAVGAPVP